MYIYIYIYIYTHNVYIYIYTHNVYIYIHIHTMCIYIYIHIHTQCVYIYVCIYIYIHHIYAIYPIYPMAGRIGVTFGRTPRRAGAATIRTWAAAIGRRWSMWCRPMTATRASRTLAFFDGWMVLMIGWLDFSFPMGRVFYEMSWAGPCIMAIYEWIKFLR